jgi:hypothetical protein
MLGFARPGTGIAATSPTSCPKLPSSGREVLRHGPRSD